MSTSESVICVNPRYCPTRVSFSGVEEFQCMVKEWFGEPAVLTHQPGTGCWVDETGERVLISARLALHEAVGDGQ